MAAVTDTFWLTLTNVVLGVLTVALCVATLAVIAVELRSRRLGRRGCTGTPEPRPRLPRRLPASAPAPSPATGRLLDCAEDPSREEEAWRDLPLPPRSGPTQRPAHWVN